MTKKTLSSGIKTLRPFAFSLLLILLAYTLLKAFHIEFNDTPSMPIGFYRRISAHQIKRGDRVAACLPTSVATEALQRGYLRTGDCPSGVIPVLKKVIALPGDSVNLTDKTITVNGVTYFAPYESLDHNGSPTQKFIPNGLYNPTHVYWLYGAHDPLNSWDSRYYGGVAQSAIRGVYKPLLTF